MDSIHVVLDSTANVPPEMLKKHANLHVVPLKVRLGDQEWTEPELSPEQLFDLIAATNKFPQTSQPAPGDFLQVIAPLTEQDQAIIVITIAGGLSGTIQSARTATQLTAAKKLYILDSGTTAVGMVHFADIALKLADQGWPVEQIVAHLKRCIDSTRTMFVPKTLEYLYKGGRIGRAAALVGGILQIRPVLYLADGKVDVLDKVRTHQRAVARMLEELYSWPDLEYIGVVHIAAPELAEQVVEQIRPRYPKAVITVTTGGSVLAAHLGPGLVGIIYQDKLLQ